MIIDVWGNAFHGLCTDGVLTLSNSDQMPYPQPENGNCSVIKFDGQPAVSLPTELQADLTSKGMEFRNYALISGYQIAGVSVPYSFIHRDDLGNRWGVDISTLTIQNNQLSGNLTLTRFGDFVETGVVPIAATQDVAVSLADCGQSSPVLTGNDEFDELTNLRLVFASAHPSGNECVLTIEGKFDQAPASLNGWAPLGFILLDISGGATLACAASVYINRADAIGVHSDVITNTYQNEIWYFDSPSQSWTTTAPAPDDIGFTATFQTGDYDLVASLTNRVLNVIYDSAGVKKRLHFSCNYSDDGTIASPSLTGEIVSSSFTGDSSGYAMLELAGNELRLDASGTGSGTVSADFIAGEGIYYDSQATLDATIDSDVTSSTSTNRFLETASSDLFTGSATSFGASILLFYKGIFAHKADIEFNSYAASGSDIERTQLRYTKRTDQLYSFNQTKIDVSQQSSYYNFGVLSPISFDATVYSIASGSSDQYATYEPMSGQIVWNSNVPVCFV